MFPKSLRPLLPYVKRYRWGYIFGTVCVLLTNGTWILFPLVLGKAADDLHSGVTRHKLLVYAGLLLAIATVKGIFQFLTRWVVIGISRDIEFDLRRFRLPLGGRIIRIPDVDGIVGQYGQSPSQANERRVKRDQLMEQAEKVVGLRHDQTLLLKECLQVLLRALLAMKADEVMKRRLSAVQVGGAAEVVFRLAHPSHGRSFHRGPFPASSPRSETRHLPQGPTVLVLASARSSPSGTGPGRRAGSSPRGHAGSGPAR